MKRNQKYGKEHNYNFDINNILSLLKNKMESKDNNDLINDSDTEIDDDDDSDNGQCQKKIVNNITKEEKYKDIFEDWYQDLHKIYIVIKKNDDDDINKKRKEQFEKQTIDLYYNTMVKKLDRKMFLLCIQEKIHNLILDNKNNTNENINVQLLFILGAWKLFLFVNGDKNNFQNNHDRDEISFDLCLEYVRQKIIKIYELKNTWKCLQVQKENEEQKLQDKTKEYDKQKERFQTQQENEMELFTKKQNQERESFLIQWDNAKKEDEEILKLNHEIENLTKNEKEIYTKLLMSLCL